MDLAEVSRHVSDILAFMRTISSLFARKTFVKKAFALLKVQVDPVITGASDLVSFVDSVVNFGNNSIL